MPRLALAALATLAGVIAVAPGASSMGVAPCSSSVLRASMNVVNGSAGAGQITYSVRLRNGGQTPCTVSGRPGLRLLDRHGKRLPTHVVPDRLGTGTAALITLAPGRAASTRARFSPDVSGPGEPGAGACEHTAHRVRVTLASPGSGSLDGPVTPATSVCEHGRIVLGLLSAR